eukprot:7388381-Prymnesium_polylepis.1
MPGTFAPHECIRGTAQALERVLEKGEQYELVVMDQHFDAGTMTGSEAIAQLRAKGAGREVIILCSGNNSQSTTGKAANSVQADATWGKPWPDWRNGDMQRQLAPLSNATRRRRTPEGAPDEY